MRSATSDAGSEAGWLRTRSAPVWAATSAVRAPLARVPRPYLAVGVLVIAQAGWLAAWCARGWFVNDDFSFMAEAVHHPLSWHYLTAHSGGHLFPGFRLLFWSLARGSHLDYPVTVALRVGLQAAATILLWRLLIALTRSWRLALLITAGYAVSPILIPGTMYLSSSLNLLPAQVCVLLAFLGAVRHAATGSRWASLQAGAGLFASALFWEKTALDGAVFLVLLMAGWLTHGGLRERVGSIVRDWWAWLLTFGPLAAFGFYYLTHHYGASAHGLPVHAIPRLGWDEWAHALWPSVLGGPWKWFALPSIYVSLASVTTAATIVGQAGFVVLLLVGWRRNGWRSLLAWVPLAVTLVVGITIVGLGRYALLNQAMALDYHYLFDLAVPSAVAVALALRRGAATAELATASVGLTPVVRRGDPRLKLGTAVLLAAALVVSSAISTARWTQRWRDSPAHRYVDNLSAAARGPVTPPAVYDTGLPASLIAPVDAYRHVSDLAALARLPLAFQNGSANLELVDPTGRIVPASFEPVATGVVTRKPLCSTLISGTQSVTVRLSSATLPPASYFLRLQYFQNTVAVLTVTAKTADGRSLPVANGDDVQLGEAIGQQTFKLAPGSPATVTIAGKTAATHLCATQAAVGVPVVTAR